MLGDLGLERLDLEEVASEETGEQDVEHGEAKDVVTTDLVRAVHAGAEALEPGPRVALLRIEVVGEVPRAARDLVLQPGTAIRSASSSVEAPEVMAITSLSAWGASVRPSVCPARRCSTHGLEPSASSRHTFAAEGRVI